MQLNPSTGTAPPQSHALLTPDIAKNDMSWDEVGILSQMLNVPECDYITPEQLARYSSDSPETVRKLLDGLVEKDFVQNMDGIYCINKYRIPDMKLTRIQEGQVIRFTDDADGEEA